MTARARPEPAPSDGGQAVPLMLVVLLAAVVAVMATIEVGRLLNDSARARTAADAAALAGASAGRAEAARLATANGGQLLAYAEDRPTTGDDEEVQVTVAVQVGRVSQSARAEAAVEWVAPQ